MSYGKGYYGKSSKWKKKKYVVKKDWEKREVVSNLTSGMIIGRISNIAREEKKANKGYGVAISFLSTHRKIGKRESMEKIGKVLGKDLDFLYEEINYEKSEVQISKCYGDYDSGKDFKKKLEEEEIAELGLDLKEKRKSNEEESNKKREKYIEIKYG